MKQTKGLMVLIILIALININAVAGSNIDVKQSTDQGFAIQSNSLSVSGEGTKTYTVIGAPTTTFTAPCTNCAAASGGSGGGGVGGVSGEDYSNIVLKEKYEEAIYKDISTSFMFKSESSPVMFINITGNVNAGLINTAAELLRGTSTLVSEAPPGFVYKNINLWVGTSGFATSKNIKEAIVMFRVDNTWIDTNSITRSDIKLIKWDGDKWITLETKEKMKDGTYTYFDGKTTSFSQFAITGIKAATNSAEPNLAISSTVPVLTTEQPTTSEKEEAMTVDLSVVAGLIGIIAIVVVLYLRRKN